MVVCSFLFQTNERSMDDMASITMMLYLLRIFPGSNRDQEKYNEGFGVFVDLLKILWKAASFNI